ncbi:MAG: hypothetical protein MJE66_20630 [Proteobacteria bacterium]|nr:hypothetical protein [Pseudomonadota bacterium]
MATEAGDTTTLLDRALANQRVHSAYLLSGPAETARAAAERFARGLVCENGDARPCESCRGCRRSQPGDRVDLDGTGKKGPLYRHVGDHPDLLWVERGVQDTRVRIGQVRAVQQALRLGANEGGWRVAVLADAEWLNQEAQNALLRLLEEPPERTCLLLIAPSAAALLATIRSRCQRVEFAGEAPLDPFSDEAPEEWRTLAARIEAIPTLELPELLEWAEEFRGERARAAAAVETLLGVGSAWIRRRVVSATRAGQPDVARDLDAFRELLQCRKDLVQRNANPQMVAERALLACREAT